jgi:hypothetical protein
MQQINFVGVTPDNFLNELVSQVKTALLTELQQSFKDNEPNRYYTAEQICERFSITKPTIHEYRKRKIIKSYRLGSRVYYRLDEIENAMIIND